MSLIDKIQQQSLLQNKLLAQIAEMSLQAINNTRQSARNFKEGTLEIGKMHFTTPQDKITKEMIMDYQKSEQEKRTNIIDPATGKQLLYQPTGLADVIDTFVPIDYGPLGAPATEEDVRNYEADYLQLFNNLDTLKNNYDNKDKEYRNKIAEHNEKIRQINETLTELKAAQQNTINLKKELKETNDNIVAHNASLPTGATPSDEFTKTLDDLDAKEL
jgi:hypothetical protein